MSQILQLRSSHVLDASPNGPVNVNDDLVVCMRSVWYFTYT